MLTIGHSTLPIGIFLAALEENGVQLLVDVRTVPRSRHNPQYNLEALAASLNSRNIEYRWMRELGGLRHSRAGSPNQGWRNLNFRGYADYMQTAEFAAALQTLMALEERKPTAILCSEAVPWRCHRSLIGDALLVRGRSVEDIYVSPNGKTHRKPHLLTPFAKIEGTRILYPAEGIQAELPLQQVP